MIIGFTGTRKGMTGAQKRAVGDKCVLLCGPFSIGLHGCAEGADREFHEIACKVPRHLFPVTAEQRAWAEAHVTKRDIIFDLNLAPIPRNHVIAARAQCIFAAPKGQHEELRSGTWATIRHARKLRLPVYLFWPDGHVTHETP